jgi:hypothetical protein
MNDALSEDEQRLVDCETKIEALAKEVERLSRIRNQKPYRGVDVNSTGN